MIVICLIASLNSIFSTFSDLYMIKFPNYCSYFPSLQTFTRDPDCTYQYVLPYQNVGIWVPLIITMMVLSIGVARHYKNFKKYQKRDEEGPLSRVYDILKRVTLTVDGSLSGYRKTWEQRVLRDYFQSVVDNCVDYEDFINADDSLLKTLNINAHGHRKKILEITSKLSKK